MDRGGGGTRGRKARIKDWIVPKMEDLSDEAKADTRIVYGAMCTYWGPVQSIGVREGVGEVPGGIVRIPCCPWCGGMLMEMPTEADWVDSARRFEESSEGSPGHTNVILWARGRRCYPTWEIAVRVYARLN